MMWTEQRIKYIIADLTDENLFACRSLLSDITLSFSEEIQTLAISLQDRAELILNPAFLNKYIHNESDFKVIILHEYLHLLFFMKYPLDSPMSHLALDAIINAAICRKVNYFQRDYHGQSDSFFSRFYPNSGATKFLRGNETEHRFTKLLRHFREIFKEESLTDIIFLGNHEIPEISEKYVLILLQILEQMNPDDIRNRSFTSNEDLEYIEQHGHQMRHLKDWQARTYSLLEEMMARFTPKDSHKKENRIRVYLDHNGFMENEMNMLIPLLERLKAGIDLPVLVFTSEEVKPAVFPEGYLLMERHGRKNLSQIIHDMKQNGIKGSIVITCGRHLNVKSAAVLAEEQLNISFLVSKMGNKAVFEKHGLAFQLLEPLILLENDFKRVKKPTVILNEGTVNK